MFDTEYSYDMPSSSTHHHPFHVVHIHHHHSKYSPSTKSADISRLLDPSYSSHSAYGPSSSQTRVYVDHHGDLHDPDYRHFPASPPPKPKTRRNRRVSDSDPFSSRPQWVLGVDADELEAYEDVDADAYPSYPAHALTHSNRRSSSLTRPKASYMSSPFYPISPSSSYTPSPPTSFSDDDTVFSESPDSASASPFSDDKKCTPTNLLTKKFRRPSRKSSPTTPSTIPTATTTTGRTSLDSVSSPFNYTDEPCSAEPESEEHVHPFEGGEDIEEDFHHGRRRSMDLDDALREEDDEDDARDAKSENGVPSCTQVMRRQWQAVSLSVRFGVFRARRRMRRVLSR